VSIARDARMQEFIEFEAQRKDRYIDAAQTDLDIERSILFIAGVSAPPEV